MCIRERGRTGSTCIVLFVTRPKKDLDQLLARYLLRQRAWRSPLEVTNAPTPKCHASGRRA
eukprot:1379930-Rhodomonas_salina.2